MIYSDNKIFDTKGQDEFTRMSDNELKEGLEKNGYKIQTCGRDGLMLTAPFFEDQRDSVFIKTVAAQAFLSGTDSMNKMITEKNLAVFF